MTWYTIEATHGSDTWPVETLQAESPDAALIAADVQFADDAVTVTAREATPEEAPQYADDDDAYYNDCAW